MDIKLVILYAAGALLLASAVGAFGMIAKLDAAHASAVDAERAAAGLPPKPMPLEAGPVIAGLFAAAGGGLSIGAVLIALAFMLGH
jgi:hypothetical protein